MNKEIVITIIELVKALLLYALEQYGLIDSLGEAGVKLEEILSTPTEV